MLLSLGAGTVGALGEAHAGEQTRWEKIVYVGESRIRLLVTDVNGKGKHAFIYFHPHENEHGSAVVTRHTIRESGGRLIEIRSSGERLITFRLRGTTYSFDPNRMFTDAGLESSLAHFAPIPAAAFDCAHNLRKAVINLLNNGKTPLVAVHNTAEDGINVLSYKKGGRLEQQAAKLAVNPQERPQNFFVVLDPAVYDRLHHAGFNTVLKSPTAPDDGSLATFCQQHHWQYVTVEAAESDMNQQQRMLDALPAAIA